MALVAASRWSHQFYSKRIPTNPKFDSVKPVVSTGPTMRLVEVLADNQISRRKQETFRRVSAKLLRKMILKEREGETVFDLFEEGKRARWGDQELGQTQSRNE